jgi:hypothetical protein
MAKKKQRATQTSKGLTHQNPNRLGRKISKEQRREYVASGREHNQLLAFKRGKNVVVTVPNPNKNETAKPFIKISGKDYFKGIQGR